MHKGKRDIVTTNVAAYVKEHGLQINAVAQGTGISSNVMKTSLEKGTRKLHVDEFLTICCFVNKDPHDFIIATLMPTEQSPNPHNH